MRKRSLVTQPLRLRDYTIPSIREKITMLSSLVAVALLTPAADPSPVLQVVRVKPGEMKSVELALGKSGINFRPKGVSGRDFLDLSVVTVVDGVVKETEISKESKGSSFTGRYLVTPDFTVVWSKDKPELEFHAGKDMKKGTTDLRIVYRSFGGGDFIAGFLVIVE